MKMYQNLEEIQVEDSPRKAANSNSLSSLGFGQKSTQLLSKYYE
jgi:hypothetical protein